MEGAWTAGKGAFKHTVALAGGEEAPFPGRRPEEREDGGAYGGRKVHGAGITGDEDIGFGKDGRELSQIRLVDKARRFPGSREIVASAQP